jgi:hypothetical protein
LIYGEKREEFILSFLLGENRVTDKQGKANVIKMYSTTARDFTPMLTIGLMESFKA